MILNVLNIHKCLLWLVQISLSTTFYHQVPCGTSFKYIVLYVLSFLSLFFPNLMRFNKEQFKEEREQESNYLIVAIWAKINRI